jgi:hypothetical protein
MPDTGERREITRFVKAKEAKTVQEANKVVAKKIEEAMQDREAKDRMADEGNPIPKP